MEHTPFDHQHCLSAFMKTAQYLVNLTTHQNIWSHMGKVMVNFFGAGLAGFAERSADGEIIGHDWILPEPVSEEAILTTVVKGIVAEVLDSGFPASHVLRLPHPCSLALLPIAQAHQTTAVLIVGHAVDAPLPNELLDVYLAVAGLAGTTVTKLASDVELRRHRSRLEELVNERTVEITLALDRLEREIVERKHVEERLLKAKDAAEAANRAKSEFLANMSHELRTPLNAILGFTELILDRRMGELTKLQEEHLGDVLLSSRHLLSLINDILDLSKVEAGKLELMLSCIYLEDLLMGSLVMIKERALNHGIAISTHFDRIPQTIVADERKIKQVLYNLLSNAVKFTPGGGSVYLASRMATMEELEGHGIHTAYAPSPCRFYENDKGSRARRIHEACRLCEDYGSHGACLIGRKAEISDSHEITRNEMTSNQPESDDSGNGSRPDMERGGPSIHLPHMMGQIQGPSEDSGYIQISVSDTGIGLKTTDFERIFNPFEQADGSMSRIYQGTGLGLSLARRLVELHQGKIWVESEGEGKGSTFCFVIPVSASPHS